MWPGARRSHPSAEPTWLTPGGFGSVASVPFWCFCVWPGIASRTGGDAMVFGTLAIFGAVALWWYTAYLVGWWFLWVFFIGAVLLGLITQI